MTAMSSSQIDVCALIIVISGSARSKTVAFNVATINNKHSVAIAMCCLIGRIISPPV